MYEHSRVQKYPAKVGAYEVSHVVDLTVGYDSRAADLKSTIPKQSGQVITFFLANGGVITFRTSGTEPKIKFYSEWRVSTSFVTALYITGHVTPAQRRQDPRDERAVARHCGGVRAGVAAARQEWHPAQGRVSA